MTIRRSLLLTLLIIFLLFSGQARATSIDAAAITAFMTGLHAQFTAEKQQEAKEAREKADADPTNEEKKKEAEKKEEIAKQVTDNNKNVNRSNDGLQDRVKQDGTHNQPSQSASEGAKGGAEGAEKGVAEAAAPEQSPEGLPSDAFKPEELTQDNLAKTAEAANQNSEFGPKNSGVQKDTTPPSTSQPELNKPTEPNAPPETAATKAPDSAMPEESATPSSASDSGNLARTEPSSPSKADTNAKPLTGYAPQREEPPSLLNQAAREAYAQKALQSYKNRIGEPSPEKADRILNSARSEYDEAVYAIGHDYESSMFGASQSQIAQSLIMNPPGSASQQASSAVGSAPARVRPGIRGRGRF